MGALFYDLDNETMRERCLGRSGGRADDNEATVKKRLATYESETLPLVQSLTGKIEVFTVNAKQSKEAVFADTQVIIEKL